MIELEAGQGIKGAEGCGSARVEEKAETRNRVRDSISELVVSRELGLGCGRAEDSAVGELKGKLMWEPRVAGVSCEPGVRDFSRNPPAVVFLIFSGASRERANEREPLASFPPSPPQSARKKKKENNRIRARFSPKFL
ncbi:hypothetical protein CDL15_Pgr012719 [Punica granatum]|uniref:Uncharacterized protein n=1 Tax=Punica granatum TaxID=22663 RepID=A0A218XEK3_PUNGR|nr:hypothetical protein CDL15_Pgr012719 [Punica granatum]